MPEKPFHLDLSNHPDYAAEVLLAPDPTEVTDIRDLVHDIVTSDDALVQNESYFHLGDSLGLEIVVTRLHNANTNHYFTAVFYQQADDSEERQQVASYEWSLGAQEADFSMVSKDVKDQI